MFTFRKKYKNILLLVKNFITILCNVPLTASLKINMI